MSHSTNPVALSHHLRVIREFPAEDRTGLDKDDEVHVWEDSWDKNNVEDEFLNLLREELGKQKHLLPGIG
uniref:26S proteasome complex subunit SEM1 n=1 Tax=Kryptolebias marmoratus TaxID=37003 RepID=A0A3Q3GHU1_KRYMA